MSSQTQATRFLVVILHRSELLADAAVLGQHVTSRLAGGGWKCTYVLQNLDSWDPIIFPLGEEHLHILLAVMTGYIRALKPQAVHGHEADNISEFLAAVMICSGKNLPYSEEARALEIEMDGLLDCHHVLVRWNLRGFNAQAWGQLVADLGQVTLEGVDQALERVISTWMLNKEVFLHSDLVWYPMERPTLTLVASIFETRPFGRSLPDIKSTCTCQAQNPRYRRKPKRWNVKHNCKDGMDVKDVTVYIECSLYGQTWLLPTQELYGVVSVIGDAVAVVAAGWTMKI